MLVESYERRKDKADGNNGKDIVKKQAKDLVNTEVQKDIVERTSVEGLLF